MEEKYAQILEVAKSLDKVKSYIFETGKPDVYSVKEKEIDEAIDIIDDYLQRNLDTLLGKEE